MGDWDKSLKSLVADCPRAFAELVLRELKLETQGIKHIVQLDTQRVTGQRLRKLHLIQKMHGMVSGERQAEGNASALP